jgi:hypothetical protein
MYEETSFVFPSTEIKPRIELRFDKYAAIASYRGFRLTLLLVNSFSISSSSIAKKRSVALETIGRIRLASSDGSCENT